MERTYILYGGIIDYNPSFLSQSEADNLYSSLKNNVEWEQKHYVHRKTGQSYPQPRLTAWYANNSDMEYSYSGVTQRVQKWTPELLDIKSKIEAASGASYNSVLLNFYRDGSDSVGAHADDESELGINANIASLSLGITRRFEMQNYRIPKNNSMCNTNECQDNNISYKLSNGSLLVMSGTTQHYWKHAVPKELDLTGGRINLTFRKFYV